MKKPILILIGLIVLVPGHVRAMAETPEEQLMERLTRFEAEVQAVKDELKQMKSTTDQTKATEEIVQNKEAEPAFVFWKDDFFLSTADENFWLKIRGNLHFDTKFYGGNSNDPSPQFDIRRARLDFQGMWYKYIYFRVQPEFADSPYIRNAWVDFKFKDWLHLRTGQMKPPFGTCWRTTDNNVNFLERRAGTPVYPFFDRGSWVWGDILNKTLTWNVGIFTGAGIHKDNPGGDIDDHKDYVGRLFYTPFKNWKDSLFEGFHLCVEGDRRQAICSD